MKKTLLSITLIVLASITFAGEKENTTKAIMKSLSINIVDENNESIAGAEIFIEDLGLTSYTDMEGNLTLDIPTDAKGEIKVSFISFEDKTLKISNIKNGKITLTEE